MTQYIIDEKLADDILEYLSTQKYKEVADLIEGLRKLVKVEATK